MSYFKKLWKIFSLMVLELNCYVSHLQRLGKLLGLYMEPQRKTGTTLPETKIAPHKMASQKKIRSSKSSFRRGTTWFYLYFCWVVEIKVSFYLQQGVGFSAVILVPMCFFFRKTSAFIAREKKLENHRIGSEISGFVICGRRSWLQCNISRFSILVSFCSTGWYHLWTWYLQSCEWRGDRCCRRSLAWPRHGSEFCHRPHVLVVCLIVLEDLDTRETSSFWREPWTQVRSLQDCFLCFCGSGRPAKQHTECIKVVLKRILKKDIYRTQITPEFIKRV